MDFSAWNFGLPTSFPSYVIAVFLVPILSGAWRFVIFHAVVGPGLASMLTDNPNEIPAIWCFFSIGIVVLGHSSPEGVWSFLKTSVTKKILDEFQDMAIWVNQ